jgi:hypothetical protein
MKPINDPHIERFTFAGFQWPRYVATMTPLPGLRKQRETRRYCGGYYHAPVPNSHNGRGFYLSDAGQPFTRWEWCDNIDGARINHTGWWADEHCDSKIRGIVVRLPHGRFMAGWSMGEGMASSLDPDIYPDAVAAAYAADSIAENAADREREYQATTNPDGE